MRRKPSVAGLFYPGNHDELLRMVEGMVDHVCPKDKALCAVSPHAGFIYSGAVAGALFSVVEVPETVVLLGPAHRMTSSRDPYFIMGEGIWDNPLGEIQVDARLSSLLKEALPDLRDDPAVHSQEHSLEVQLPFLQAFKKDFSIVPICLSVWAGFDALEGLGRALAECIAGYDSEVLVVASTDMSHYVSREEAERKDFLAIEQILNLDPEGLFETVRKENISMCGVFAATAGLVAAKKLGATRAELIKYQTSGEVSGDFKEVVGYAGLKIT